MRYLTGDAPTELSGIGDSSFWEGAVDPNGDRYIHLHVLKHSNADVYFMIQMIPRPERVHAEIERLASLVVDRIP